MQRDDERRSTYSDVEAHTIEPHTIEPHTIAARAPREERWRSYPDGLIVRSAGRRTLWVEGDINHLRGTRVAVIGSRHPTPEQAHFTTGLCAALAAADAILCSGGALGVDALVHHAALGAERPTALVSPVAPGRAYPPSHAGLFSAVVGSGVVISPFAPGTPLHRAHFRTRNGVLARLVDALIVICADARSGSLHCARQAWKLGLPVFAVPWSPGSLHAEGGNLLLSAGARAISHPAQAAALVAQVRAGQGRAWLTRDPAPPSQVPGVAVGRGRRAAQGGGRGGRVGEARRPGLVQPSEGLITAPIDADLPSPIDAARGRWQRYAPPAQRPTGHADVAHGEQDAEFSAFQAQDSDGAVRRALRQRPEGASLEQLVIDTGEPRGRLAKLLLRWTLRGAVRRDRWGRYHDG